MNRLAVSNRRQSEVFAFEHNGIAFTGSVSRRQEDWRVVEIFLDGGKVGTAIQAVARDTAVAASLALQHGCPIDVLRLALTRNDDNGPAGPLGSLLDLVEAA